MRTQEEKKGEGALEPRRGALKQRCDYLLSFPCLIKLSDIHIYVSFFSNSFGKMTLILWAILFAQADAVVIQGSWWVWITLFRGDLCVELCAPYILRLFKFQIFCFLLEYVLQLHSKLWFSFHKIWSHKKMLWPPAAKNWFIWKDLDAGKDWKQKGTTEDEMVGWHHQLTGHGFE